MEHRHRHVCDYLFYDDDDDDEIVHLREMDRWPGLLSDSLDVSKYIHSHHCIGLCHIWCICVFV